MKKTNLKVEQPRGSGSVSYVEMQCGTGFLSRQFSGTSFLAALIELIKNSRDWGATIIDITTDIPELLRVADNASGMNPPNKQAFCSISATTAGAHQTGTYDTGSKKMLFGFASQVDVRSIDRNVPGVVDSFTLQTDSYQSQLLGSNDRRVAVMSGPVTPEIWPYPYKCGTVLTYTLRNPKSKAVWRGKALAEALSARCPDKFKDIIRVDGLFILGKGDQSKLFNVVEQHSQLGTVTLELYRSDRRRIREESLLLGAGEIGEVPFQNFAERLGDLAVDLPEVYGMPGVCGVVSVAYFKDYINEDRKSFNPRIADDKRTFLLVQLLRRFAPLIENRLGINVKTDAQTEDLAVIEEFAKLCNKRYNPKGDLPPTHRPGDRLPEPSSDGKLADDPNGEPNLGLKSNSEYEIDETVEIRISNPGRIEFDQESVHWYTKDSHAESISKTERGLTMVAATEGYGSVRMDVTGTPFSAKTHYTVVKQRQFRLNASQSTLQVGQTLTLMGINSDKLKGKVMWSLSGAGKTEPQGARVVYFATSAGKAVITASDDKNPRIKVTCEIQVFDPVPPNLKIRDHFFKIIYLVTSAYATDQKPVFMRGVKGAKMHDVFFNTQAPGYKLAHKQGNLTQFLGMATALEFARFQKFDLEQEHLDGNVFEMPEMATNMQELAYDIYSELLG